MLSKMPFILKTTNLQLLEPFSSIERLAVELSSPAFPFPHGMPKPLVFVIGNQTNPTGFQNTSVPSAIP